MEATPTPVPKAKQVGEVRARWAWTEPSVWTERMLMALEEGVKGGIWFSLIDKAYSLRNLHAAFAQVKANGGAAGVDHVSIEMFAAHLEANLMQVAEQLAAGKYQPQAVRRKWIPLPLQDQLDRKAFCATFFRIADGVLNVANVVDHAIEGGVGVSADVNG